MKLDEFSIGDIFETKPYALTEEDVKKFASEFDPQYMHSDHEKASQGMFQGIIASGIHTLALSFKLWVEEGKYGDDVIAGTKMEAVKFIKPVYPTDVLSVRAEVINKKVLNDEQGLLTVRLSTFNDKNIKVYQAELTALIKR
jgi:acyl dehydratase